MRTLALLLVALLAACSGGHDMDQPAVIINDPAITPTVTASSTASGYDIDDVLVGNELKGWKPATTVPAWSDSDITDLPAASAAVYNFAIVYDGYLYASYGADTPRKTARLDLTDPSGAWSDAGVTDVPSAVGQYGYFGGIYNGKLYLTLLAFNVLYELDLSAPTGSWTTYTPGTSGVYSAVVGQYLYTLNLDNSGTVQRLNLANIAAGYDDSVPDVPAYEIGQSYGAGLIAIDNYLYAYSYAALAPGYYNDSNTIKFMHRIDTNNISAGWEAVSVPAVPAALAAATYFFNLNGQLAALYRGSGAYSGYVWIYSTDADTWDVITVAGDDVADRAVIATDGLKIFALGSYSGTATTSMINLATAYIDFDFSVPVLFNSVAILADNAANSYIHVTGCATADFADETIIATARLASNATYVPVDTNSVLFRYYRIKFFNIGSNFLLKYIELSDLLLLPYLADGADLDRYKTTGAHQISPSGYYIGSVKQATMRDISLDFGQVTTQELSAFRQWAQHAIADMKPFFFIPDTAASDCWWCWTADSQAFSAPMKNGLYDIGTIKINARVS